MELNIQLNRDMAEDFTNKILAMTEKKIVALSVRELLQYWYAAIYTHPWIDPLHPETWQAFDSLVRRVLHHKAQGNISEYQLMDRVEDVRKLAGLSRTFDATEPICDHCKESFLDPTDHILAFDKDGKEIRICDACRFTDFHTCHMKGCDAIYPNDALLCPVCRMVACKRRPKDAAATTELRLPDCPFCAGLELERTVDSERVPYMQCKKCGCRVPSFYWDHRPREDVLRDRIKVLTEALRLALPYIDPNHPCEQCHDRSAFALNCGSPCDSYHDIKKDQELIQDVLAGKQVTFQKG